MEYGPSEEEGGSRSTAVEDRAGEQQDRHLSRKRKAEQSFSYGVMERVHVPATSGRDSEPERRGKRQHRSVREVSEEPFSGKERCGERGRESGVRSIESLVREGVGGVDSTPQSGRRWGERGSRFRGVGGEGERAREGEGGRGKDGEGGRVEESEKREESVQFFVRTLHNNRNLVMRANRNERVELVMAQIRARTGIPTTEQRLLFNGRQLLESATLAECHVAQDCTLNLVSRLRSTACPEVWLLVAEMADAARQLADSDWRTGDPAGEALAVGGERESENCAETKGEKKGEKGGNGGKGAKEPSGENPTSRTGLRMAKTQEARIKQSLMVFWTRVLDTSKGGMEGWSQRLTEYIEAFRMAGGPKVLVGLLHCKAAFAEECIQSFLDEEVLALFASSLPSAARAAQERSSAVVVELAALLEGQGQGDRLAATCRAALVRLLARRGSAALNRPPDWIVRNLWPFLHKAAAKVERGLRDLTALTAGTTENLAVPLELRDAEAFATFAVPLCKAVPYCKTVDIGTIVRNRTTTHSTAEPPTSFTGTVPLQTASSMPTPSVYDGAFPVNGLPSFGSFTANREGRILREEVRNFPELKLRGDLSEDFSNPGLGREAFPVTTTPNLAPWLSMSSSDSHSHIPSHSPPSPPFSSVLCAGGSSSTTRSTHSSSLPPPFSTRDNTRIPIFPSSGNSKGRDTCVSSTAFCIDVNPNSTTEPLCSMSPSTPTRYFTNNFQSWLPGLFFSLLRALDECLLESTKFSQRLLLLADGPTYYKRRKDEVLRKALMFVPEPIKVTLPVILKGLHAIASLSEYTETALLHVLRRHITLLNAVISTEELWPEGDLYWLQEHRDLLEYSVKRRWVLALLPQPADYHSDRHSIQVERGPALLRASLEAVGYAHAEALKEGLLVRFAHEEGAGGGVLREWFMLVGKELFSVQHALFQSCPTDHRRYAPSPMSGVNPGHLMYFKFAGRVVGLALLHRLYMNVTLSRAFFKLLAGRDVTWEDAEDMDPELHASCRAIIDLPAADVDADVLALTFTCTVEEFGEKKIVELCPDGQSIKVTSTNRRRFVDLLVKRKLVTPIFAQAEAFASGWSDLIEHGMALPQFLKPLDPTDLEAMLYGEERDIDVADWEAHTDYHGYRTSDPEVLLFWRVVTDMSPHQRRQLLYFATAIVRLPPEGFGGLPSRFHIHLAHTDVSHLPTAHTCFQQLLLPPYPNYALMRARLLAVTEEHTVQGFGFV